MARNDFMRDRLMQRGKEVKREEDALVQEAKRILKKDLFNDQKILENLRQYNRSFEKPDEENLPADHIFRPEEIRDMAIRYRLKWLDSKLYKPEIPYEAVLRIKYLNDTFHKDIRYFKILSVPESFHSANQKSEALLFALTNYDNYYLVHSWGQKIKWYRSIQFWPLKRFESLVLSVLAISLIITLVLPTFLNTLPLHRG